MIDLEHQINIRIPFGPMKGQTTQFTGINIEYKGFNFILGKIGFCNEKKAYWKIYEPQSALSCTGSCDTKKEAIAELQARIDKVGVEHTKHAIANAVLNNGEQN